MPRHLARVVASVVFGLMVSISGAAAAVTTDYRQWLSAVPQRMAEVQKFEAFLRQSGVGGLLPTNQLLLSASSWRGCGADSPYTLPPENDWRHIVGTLKFIRERVAPAIGKVNAVSGYRSPELGKCAGGAPKSAHGEYYALDLVPVRAMNREAMIATLCTLYHRYGVSSAVGLGFYEGMRFHVDTKSARLWGSDYHAATSPCVVGVAAAGRHAGVSGASK